MRSVALSDSSSNSPSMMPGMAALAWVMAVAFVRSKLETKAGPRRAVLSVSMTSPAAPAARARREKSMAVKEEICDWCVLWWWW
jgi:hypothetical protein